MKLNQLERGNLKAVLGIQCQLRPIYPEDNYPEMLSHAEPNMLWQTLSGNRVPSGGITREVYRDNITQDPELIELSRHHSDLGKKGKLIHTTFPQNTPKAVTPEIAELLTEIFDHLSEAKIISNISVFYQKMASAMPFINTIRVSNQEYPAGLKSEVHEAIQTTYPKLLAASDRQLAHLIHQISHTTPQISILPAAQPTINPLPKLSPIHESPPISPDAINTTLSLSEDHELSTEDAAEFTELLRAQAHTQKIHSKERYYTLLDKYLPLLNTTKYESRTLPTGGVIEALYQANKHLHPEWAQAANQHLQYYKSQEAKHEKLRIQDQQRRKQTPTQNKPLRIGQLPPDKVKQLVRLLLAQAEITPIRDIQEYRNLFLEYKDLLNTRVTESGTMATGGVKETIMEINAPFYPELVVAHETHIRTAIERKKHLNTESSSLKANSQNKQSPTKPSTEHNPPTDQEDQKLAAHIIRLCLHLSGVETQPNDQYQTDFRKTSQFFDWQTGRLKNISKTGEPTPYQRFKHYEGVLQAISHHEKHVRIKNVANSLIRYVSHITGQHTQTEDAFQADVTRIKTHIDLQTGEFKPSKNPNTPSIKTQLHRFPEALEAHQTLQAHLNKENTPQHRQPQLII